MMKIYTLCAVALMCCLASCSSIQTLTFDQLCPATVNFPERVRNVAVVNNMPATPEAKRTLLTLGEMNGMVRNRQKCWLLHWPIPNILIR